MREDSEPTPQDSQLSAFLDGELAAGEMELLVRRLEREARLQQEFARYALIGEIMRTPASARGGMASRGFAARASAAIAAEAVPAAAAVAEPVSTPAARWIRPAAGLSIAAGVAALAIVFLGSGSEPQPIVATAIGVDTAASQDSAQASAEEASYIVPEIAMTGPLLPAARLTNYVMAHSEYSSPLGRRNVLSGMLADESQAEAVPTGFVPDREPAPVESP